MSCLYRTVQIGALTECIIPDEQELRAAKEILWRVAAALQAAAAAEVAKCQQDSIVIYGRGVAGRERRAARMRAALKCGTSWRLLVWAKAVSASPSDMYGEVADLDRDL